MRSKRAEIWGDKKEQMIILYTPRLTHVIDIKWATELSNDLMEAIRELELHEADVKDNSAQGGGQ
jgi:hypothetical protein